MPTLRKVDVTLRGSFEKIFIIRFFKYIYVYLPFVNMFNAYDARSGRHPIFTLSMV